MLGGGGQSGKNQDNYNSIINKIHILKKTIILVSGLNILNAFKTLPIIHPESNLQICDFLTVLRFGTSGLSSVM